jgi:hypothetical protein
VDSNGDCHWGMQARIVNKALLEWYRENMEFNAMVEDNIERGVLVGEA